AAVEHAGEEQRELAREPLVEPFPHLESRAALQGVEQLLTRFLREGFQLGVVHERHGVSFVGMVTCDVGGASRRHNNVAEGTAHWKLDGGANITGSHNPIEYNGVKMVHPAAAPLSEEEIQTLRTTIERGDFETGNGGLHDRSPRDDYFDTIAGIVRPPRRLKVV